MAKTHAGLRVRLDVNNVQAGFLAGCSGAARVAYNFAVEQLRAHQQEWAAQRDAGVPKAQLPKRPSAIDIQCRWHAVKAERYPWHAQYPSKLYLFAFRAAARAHADWMSSKSGFPKFKSRRDEWSFRVCETLGLRPGRLLLPKLGEVRIAAPDGAQAKVRRLVRRGRARITSAKVYRDSCGTWWASLTIERMTTHQPDPADTAGLASEPAVQPLVLGVDVGIKTLAVVATADGTITHTQPSLADAARGVRDAQRAVSRADRVHAKATGATKIRRSPSKRRAKAQRRLARRHRRLAAARRELLHALTAQLAGTGAVLAVETLRPKNMMATGGARKAGLNRRLAHAALGELRRQLEYKLGPERLLSAPWHYPSSKRCSACGVENQDLTLAVRAWTCTTCATSHDRDVNAAANLAAWGEAQLAGTPLVWGTRAG
ncbi:MAG TPA: transposase, partial [Mycobacteriales bacterium]|nr:transposase [Mycobacteriales bacterium]